MRVIEFRAGVPPDTRLPRTGHDLRNFQMQTPTSSTSDSGVTHARCEAPRVNDPWRIRGSAVRACRQGRGSHRWKGRDGGERLA